MHMLLAVYEEQIMYKMHKQDIEYLAIINEV